MRFKHWSVPALAASQLIFAVPGSASADELQMAPAPQEQSASERPGRGMSMDKVEAKFGSPVKRVPAVGEPPISRWEYPGFVVYFERNLVIHSVASG